MTHVSNPNNLRDAASKLAAGVDWPTTPEGNAFWEAVYDRLVFWAHGGDTRTPFASLTPPVGVGAHSSRGLTPLEIEAHPRVQELQAKLAAHVACNDALTTRIIELELTNAALEEKQKKFKARLLAADFTSMGRV